MVRQQPPIGVARGRPFTFRLMRRLIDPPSKTSAATMGVASRVGRFYGYTSMSVLRKECVR